MKKRIIIISSFLIIISTMLLSLFLIPQKNIKEVFGVWWWNDQLESEKYLSFAQEHNITEIYYCSSELGSVTSNFIKSANKKGISVYWLQGEYEWLDNISSVSKKVEKYLKYQNDNPNARFNGIHFDIEPHQNPEFKTRRQELILNLIRLANQMKETYPNILFDYDIPFWLNDEIYFNNVSKPAYEHMIDISNRIFVMSYRDTADKIKDITKEELAYAASVNKKLILSVETSSNEGDNVSFLEEGKQVMMTQLNILKEEYGNSIGIAIHHIKSWYDLKE